MGFPPTVRMPSNTKPPQRGPTNLYGCHFALLCDIAYIVLSSLSSQLEVVSMRQTHFLTLSQPRYSLLSPAALT